MLKYLIFIIGLSPVVGVAQSFPFLGSGRESCESLWVERNQIANVAGQCFDTALGQAVFDNGDCTPGEPAMAEAALDRIARIAQAEARLACEVNTGKGNVVINGRYGPLKFGNDGVELGQWPNALRELDVFPQAAGRDRACTVVGLSDDDDGFLALRSGPDVRYPKLGQLANGDRIFSSSACLGRWCFADEVQVGNRRERVNGWFHVRWCQ